jgi:hypothetical protein
MFDGMCDLSSNAVRHSTRGAPRAVTDLKEKRINRARVAGHGLVTGQQKWRV